MYAKNNLRSYHIVFFMIDCKSSFHADFRTVGGQKISLGENFLQVILYPYPQTLRTNLARLAMHRGRSAGLCMRDQSNRALLQLACRVR